MSKIVQSKSRNLKQNKWKHFSNICPQMDVADDDETETKTVE